MGKVKVQDSATDADKKHFSKILSEDEELVFATGFGKAYMRQNFIIYLMFPGGIFLGLGAALAYFYKFNLGYGLLIGLICAMFAAFLKAYWLYHSNRYLLTTRRVIFKKGVFAVRVISSLYDKITHIEVEQGFLDRMVMHHGNVIINTAGATKDELRVTYIDKPMEFKNLLERLINREREQYGKSTGPVVTLEGEIVE